MVVALGLIAFGVFTNSIAIVYLARLLAARAGRA